MTFASTTKSGKQDSSDVLIKPRWLALLVAAFVIAFVLGTAHSTPFGAKSGV